MEGRREGIGEEGGEGGEEVVSVCCVEGGLRIGGEGETVEESWQGGADFGGE